MGRVLVAGKRSFLARRFLALTRTECTAISHEEIDNRGLFDGVGCVVNFAIHPDQRLQPYSVGADFDLALASRLPQGVRYIMLSSRMVYAGQHALGASETTPTAGLNQYGRNKLETEQRLSDLLGDRLTILRIANVLGWEAPTGHPSFILQVLHRLKTEGRILYDVSPFVKRDFVTDRYVVNVLDLACQSTTSGVFNVGSGIPLEIGQVALWVLEGHGRGELVISHWRSHDEFWLDTSKTAAWAGPPPTREQLRDACLELGRQIG